MFAYDAEIVSGWACLEGFQYKFVQIHAWLVKEEGSSQVVIGVVLATESPKIKSADGAQRRGNSITRVK